MTSFVCRPKIFQWIAMGLFAGGGAYYLWMQHRAHVMPYLPLALFLLCPLMHLFGGCHAFWDIPILNRGGGLMGRNQLSWDAHSLYQYAFKFLGP